MATRTDTYLDRGNFLTRFLGRRAGGRRINIQDTITYIYLIFGTLVMFGPVVWLVMSSFKDESLLFEENPTFLPYRQETLQIQHVELLRHAPGFYDIRVGSGHIVESDVEATNGTIHLVDNLMLPPGAREAINALDTSAYEDGDLPSEPRREALEADTGTLMTTLLDERDYLRMAGLFQQTGLDTPLAEEGPFTLLLPSEGALRNFGRQNGTDTLAALLAPENSDLLADILRYHIVRGDFSLEDLFAARGEQVTTLRDDQTLTIRVDDGREMPLFDVTFNRLTTNGALLQHVNLQASNGVAHIIDDVLLTDDLATQLAALDTSGVDPLDRPEARDNVVTPESEGPLPQIVAGQPSLSLLDRMLANTELPDMLADDDARYTMLAPSDAAWLGFADTQGEATLAALFQPENGALLADLLRLHVLDGRFLEVNLYRELGKPLPTLLDDVTHEFAMQAGRTERLAQVGSPQGAQFFMIDPDNPDAGVQGVFQYVAGEERSTTFDPLREVYFSIENYTGALETFDFWQYLYNTVFVTIVATIITLLINSMAAFALSKYRFVGRDVIFLIIISTLMVPISVILVPAFIVISRLDMTNSLWGLIIPGAATPTGVFLLRQYMLTIPDELIDAARIDGSSEWRIYWQIILPLAKPALAVLAIFSVMWRWNDFLWPLIVVSQNDKFTLQVALNAFQGALDVQWHYILAMTVLTLLPISVVFMFLQRYITSGIATTGMK